MSDETTDSQAGLSDYYLLEGQPQSHRRRRPGCLFSRRRRVTLDQILLPFFVNLDVHILCLQKLEEKQSGLRDGEFSFKEIR